MMSSSKEISKIQDKFKQLFRKGNTQKSRIEEFALTENVQNDLSPSSPLNVRTKAIKELCELVLMHRLEDKSVEKLWGLCQDLINEQSGDVRQLVFSFLNCLIKGQYERLGIMRAQFFRIIKLHNNPEDIILRFELLQTLTDNGKDILYFEEEVGPFLLHWMPDMIQAKKIHEFLSMLVTTVKFNAAYIEENVIDGLIQHISTLCYPTLVPAVVIDSLQVMDTIIAYSYLSSAALTQSVVILCRVVVIEEFYEICYKVMRNVLGTYNGHSALRTLCACLCEKHLHEDTGLLSGAIFYIAMALWGPQPLTNLRCPPSAVLPSFLCAAETFNSRIQLEIIIHLNQLIIRMGSQLHVAEWDIIVMILKVIEHQIASAPNVMPNTKVAAHFHDSLTSIEGLIDVSKFYGETEKFYELIEECAPQRPEPSIMKLITHMSQSISPTTHMWLTKLDNLIKKYYRQESRTTIRLNVVSIVANTVKANRDVYEDELIDGIIIPHFVQIANDSDEFVRAAVAQLLVEICKGCETKKCLELLDIIERLINRPFDLYASDTSANESDIEDVKIAVTGLIEVFVLKIHRLPSIHSIRIYKMLIGHLELHYTRPKVLENFNDIRYKILECFLKMRADCSYRIGYPDSMGKIKFSPYLCITYGNIERGPLSSPPPASPAVNQQPDCIITYVSLRRAFKLIIMCLKHEKDWKVLHLVLQSLPQILQNKYLILSKQGNNEIDLLVDTLSGMITDRSLCLPESLRNSNKLSRTDFHASVLLVLSNLASYHMYLDQTHQQRMIRCLVRFGLVPRCSKQCINALTICTLEMQDVMVKLLPEVLLDLSKVSATVHIASPILEFLSTLTKIPKVYANFVGDQYMAVFAISLPFTNPFKYNHYIVSLAHHVIAVWFLKCRLPFRRDFIKYITKGLQTNVLVPFEETNRTNLSSMNEDSSNRKRSSSLTEQSSRRRERTSTITRPDGKPAIDFTRHTINRALLTFYEELTETCIDFMARYTFSSCNALPRRSLNTDYILDNGHSVTWFYGNKLITITTSGCAQKAIKNDLCDKCFQTCRLDASADINSNGLKTASNNENDKEPSNSTHLTRQNSGEKPNNDTSTNFTVEENKKINAELEELPAKLQQLMSADRSKPPNGKHLCTCWCQCWAEIYIRRATGDISWIMKIQNQLPQHATMDYYPYTGMLMPTTQRQYADLNARIPDESITSKSGSTVSVPISIPGSPSKQSPSRQSSRDSIDEDIEDLYEDGSKSRNPVRRSNSSPEMSASWKNPFLQKQEWEKEELRMQEEEGAKKSKLYTKDMRVSCEAIPEEISGTGTTPPSNEPMKLSTKDESTTASHPALLSCYSYPGSTPPVEHPAAAKPAHTVPPSPNVVPTTMSLTLPLTQTSSSRGTTVHSGKLKLSKHDTTTDNTVFEKGFSTVTTLSSLPPLSSKPPQSPTQTSPRLSRHVKEGHEIQKSSSLNLKDRRIENDKQSQLDINQSQKRDRGYTISVMSTTRKPRLENLRQAISTRPKDFPRSGINPSFVFLQMYYSAQFGNTNEKPILVSSSQVVQRAVKVLDCIPPYETHRIGVIYVGEGQCNDEVAILHNSFGTIRYVEFLERLGTLVKLQDVDPQMVYLGGLEQNGSDGKFTYIWQDDVIRVTFHTATLMPNKETDPNCNNKKLHIGNNNVTIVYNESGEEYKINTIKGQFNFACIIVQPMDHNTNKVTVKAKEELKELMGVGDPKMVSDQNVALYARQLALHADLASLVLRSLKSQSQDPYASNWLERLRKIKNVRFKIMQESNIETTGEENGEKPKRWMEDFSEYV